MKKSNTLTDLQRIAELIKQLPEDKKPIAGNLYEKLVFMNNALEKLKQVIEIKGVVEPFTQGENEYLRESPALKSYNTTVQRYCLVCKQIMDFFPKQSAVKVDAELQDFLIQT